MIFCFGEDKWASQGHGYQKNLEIFNVGVTEDEYQKVKNSLDVKDFKLPIAKWIDIKEINNPTTAQKQMRGYLKELNYKDAWKEMWAGLLSEDKRFFLTLPHFNAKIFEEITGIKPEIEPSLSGKEVEVKLDGRTYKAIIM